MEQTMYGLFEESLVANMISIKHCVCPSYQPQPWSYSSNLPATQSIAVWWPCWHLRSSRGALWLPPLPWYQSLGSAGANQSSPGCQEVSLQNPLLLHDTVAALAVNGLTLRFICVNMLWGHRLWFICVNMLWAHRKAIRTKQQWCIHFNMDV